VYREDISARGEVGDYGLRYEARGERKGGKAGKTTVERAERTLRLSQEPQNRSLLENVHTVDLYAVDSRQFHLRPVKKERRLGENGEKSKG
jgi:hypothetical protein